MPGPLHFKSGDQGKGSPRDFFFFFSAFHSYFFFFFKGIGNSRARASLMPFDGD